SSRTVSSTPGSASSSSSDAWYAAAELQLLERLAPRAAGAERRVPRSPSLRPRRAARVSTDLSLAAAEAALGGTLRSAPAVERPISDSASSRPPTSGGGRRAGRARDGR